MYNASSNDLPQAQKGKLKIYFAATKIGHGFTGPKNRVICHWPGDAKSALWPAGYPLPVATVCAASCWLAAKACSLLGLIGIAGSLFLSALVALVAGLGAGCISGGILDSLLPSGLQSA